MTVEMTRKVATFDAHFRGISALGVAALSLFIGAWDDLQTGLSQYHSRLLVRSPVQEVYSYMSISTSTIGLLQLYTPCTVHRRHWEINI